MRNILDIAKALVLLIPVLYKMLQVWWEFRRSKQEKDKKDAQKWREMQELTAKERFGRIKAEAQSRLDAARRESFDERKREHLSDSED